MKKASRAIVGVVLCATLWGCGGSGRSAVAPAGTSQSRLNAPPSSPAGARTEVPQPSATSTSSSPTPAPIVGTPTGAKAGGSKPEERLGRSAFLAAAGRGLGAFHNYISKPLRRGALTRSGAALPRSAAVAAAAFAVRQLSVAARAAGREAAVRSLATPLRRLVARIREIGSALAAGQTPGVAIGRARIEVDEVSRQALAAGEPIQEIVPSIP